MISKYTEQTGRVSLEAFSGTVLNVEEPSRRIWNWEVFLNDVLHDEFFKISYFEKEVRFLFPHGIVGKVDLKRRASLNTLDYSSGLQGRKYWENFFDALVQVLQDEASLRLETTGREFGYYDGMPYFKTPGEDVIIAPPVETFYEKVKNFFVRGFIWRVAESIQWFKNLYDGNEFQGIANSSFNDFGDYVSDVIEVSDVTGLTQDNESTGWSIYQDGFTPIKSITSNKIVLYRSIFDVHGFLIASLPLVEGQAVGFWGADKITYRIENTAEESLEIV